MKTIKTKYPTLIKSPMIAPCGMNCALCMAHLREKNHCAGCNANDNHKAIYCVVCKIKNCEILETVKPKYCFKCKKFPCARLKQLDKRYRTKYGMSMIENLENIREFGVRNFIRQEKEKWKCMGCGAIICIHKEDCIFCGQKRRQFTRDVR